MAAGHKSVTNDEEATRAPLHRDRIIERALTIAAQEGLEAVSFRQLAAELRVTPMALYRHVSDKDDLLSGMADAVLGQLDVALAPDADWTDQLREVVRAFARLVIAHPAAAALLPLASPRSTLRVTELTMAILARAGFAPEDAIAIVQQLSRFVVALGVADRKNPFLSPAPPATAAAQAQAAAGVLPIKEFPHLAAAAPYLESWHGLESDWEFGMELLVAGVEALLAKRLASRNAAQGNDSPDPR